jgi:hypothetical protein
LLPAEIGEERRAYVLKCLTKVRASNVLLAGMVLIQGLNMNDLIVYAGVGILLVGLPLLFARLKTNKH